MSPRNVTEEEFKRLVQHRDCDPIERVRDAVTPKKRANPLQGHDASPYRSKLEAAYAAKLEMEIRAGLIRRYWYEPFSIWLPGKVRYKPDFLVEYEPVVHVVTHKPIYGLELIEIKGWSKNRRDGMTRLKVAAAVFPCFVWKLVTRSNGGWDETHI